MVVIRQNHIGDSPHTTAYIIVGLLYDTNNEPIENWLNSMERWYKIGYKYPEIRKKIGFDLQNKKQQSIYFTIWKHLSAISTNESQKIYNRLNVKLAGKDICGESFYYGFPQLALDDYVRINRVFGYKCVMTFPCLGDIQALSIISGTPIGTYIGNFPLSDCLNKPKETRVYGDNKTLYSGGTMIVNSIEYRPDMIICNDGYYRYYDREYNESFDIDENGPLNDKFFQKHGKCKWGNYGGK